MKKVKHRKRKKQTKSSWIKYLLVLLIVVVVFILIKLPNKNENAEITKEDVQITLAEDLVITQIGAYSGSYMEDASDEEVSDVLMIVVKNNNTRPLQYTEIILEGGEAVFSLSTLNPGESVMVLEANRKTFEKDRTYENAVANNIIFFEEALNLYEDMLKIQALDGGFNITNISGKDIDEDVIVYFKDCNSDMLCGGITYRGTIQGGMKAGEIRQVMSNNFTQSNTKVMFVTITETR